MHSDKTKMAIQQALLDSSPCWMDIFVWSRQPLLDGHFCLVTLNPKP
jgi:hypothetical protein